MREWNTRQQGRPARSPDYLISLPEQTISPEVGTRLVSLSLTDQRGFESDQLDITLSDHDGRLALPVRGVELQLSIGWKGEGLIDRGKFTVDEVEHSGAPDVVIIRARAADMRQGFPAKRSQSWHQITVDDVVTTIAVRNGLEPSVSPSLASTLLEHVDQTSESDMHFLTRLGQRFDAIATVKAGYLLFLPTGEASTVSGSAIPTYTLTRSAGDRHRYVINDRDAYTGVIAYWQDMDAAERKQALVGSDQTPKRMRETKATEAEALEAAKAEWNRVRRAGATFSVDLSEGRPDLYPETPIIAKGWKSDIDETPWIVTQVSHNVSDSAYTGSVAMEVTNG
jgi:phage protein D